MSQQKTVSINGVHYDSHSGMPVSLVQAVAPVKTNTQKQERTSGVHAKGVHARAQRSTALNRQFVTKKATATPAKRMDIARPKVSRSPAISKFASHQHAVSTQRSASESKDIAPVTHPLVHKANAAIHTKPQHYPTKALPSAQEIKHSAISSAMSNAAPTTHDHAKKAKKPGGKGFHVATASLAMLLVAGYFTYLNMPNLSVRVAAAQAGINASYPEYRPVGYRLNGPVAYRDGEVSMQFASNSNSQTFALSQEKSGWDSSALLSNFVTPQSQGEYATYSDAGLTIYTYGTNAAWVNGGILYTIEGSATLSNEQVRRIATSM